VINAGINPNCSTEPANKNKPRELINPGHPRAATNKIANEQPIIGAFFSVPILKSIISTRI
jgi:hypothetical protein